MQYIASVVYTHAAALNAHPVLLASNRLKTVVYITFFRLRVTITLSKQLIFVSDQNTIKRSVHERKNYEKSRYNPPGYWLHGDGVYRARLRDKRKSSGHRGTGDQGQ
jgi:hypothetical protein